MTDRLTQPELESYLWGAAIILRGLVDAGDYKQYIFPLLFYKRLSDVWDAEYADALTETNDDAYARSMADVASEAERLGGICIAAHIDRDKTGFEAVIQGYPNSKRDIITSAGLYGLECFDAAHLCWYSDDDEPTANPR